MRPMPCPRALLRLAIAALIALPAVLPGAARADEIVIDVEDQADPFSRADGTGYANDVLRAAYAAVGVKVRLDVVPYARCKANVLAAKVAACFSMSWEPGFEGRLLFSERPLFSVHAVLVSDPSRPLLAKRTQDIPAGTVVGVVNGYEYPPAVAELVSRGVVLEPTNSEETNLRKLAAGRVDAAVLMVSTQPEHSPDRATLKGGKRYVPAMTLGTMGSHIGYSMGYPGADVARRQFDDGLRRIEADGTLAKIAHRWRTPVRNGAAHG
jgi:polar amino acid transport system substrate-binding protein